MKPLRILLATETYPPDTNGAAIFVERLAKGLSRAGHVAGVIAPSTRFKDEVEVVDDFLSIYRLKSVAVKPIHPYFRVISKINLHKKINQIVLDFKPDIIHIQSHFSAGKNCLSAARENDVPIIGTNHFMPANVTEYFPKLLEKTIEDQLWFDFIKVYDQLDYVTAPSLVAAKMIQDLGLRMPVQTISNGIDLAKFVQREVGQGFCDKYGLEADIPIFLFVGRLEEDKNVDLLLQSLKMVLDKKKVKLVVVGKGADERKIKKLAQTLDLGDNVLFTDRIPEEDLIDFYNTADVYIGSGTAELQGLAVMEAMASALPILAINAVALPELVENGVNGYLFEKDACDLADKMMEIISDKKRLESMGKESLRLIGFHDEQETIRKFEEVYHRVIGMK